MEDLSMHSVHPELDENQKSHRTDGFTCAKALVVRRGAPFRLHGQPFNPRTDSMRIQIMLGQMYMTLPVTFSKNTPSSQWSAYIDPNNLNLQKPSIFISSPASAPVGLYKFILYLYEKNYRKSSVFGQFIMLFNPWCPEDSVYIPFEDQREEFVLSDSGLLFMGTPMSLVSRPWSFDQYEPGVLEACLNLLQVSPQQQKNGNKDYLNRSDPVYISRVVSAMINCEDDHGVLKGNWSGDFKDGVNPSKWTGSGDIMRQWVQSGCSPVKYGQCWVFAAVMCTVMRVLGIPCRVVTNFNSAHDTNANLVIEEYYSETGEKLNLSKDSIWNFHVWVECWMTRRDLGSDMDGWQVLDPTPQQRSGGVFCCGPAPVKAIRSENIGLRYDIPFVFTEVNADVHTFILGQDQVLDFSIDTERVGSMICTKAVGFSRPQNITGDYKFIKSPASSLSSRSSTISEDSTLNRAKGVEIVLIMDKSPVAGEPICFSVKVKNRQRKAKRMKVHFNAQTKEYNHSPLDTFWESHGVMNLAPMEVKVIKNRIHPTQYVHVGGDNLINLAVVMEDMATHQRFLASEEFNIVCSGLTIQVADEDSVVLSKEHTAIVSFINPFSHPVNGSLTVVGAGLIQGKTKFRILPVSPGGKVEQSIKFIPSMAGEKMLHASLSLSNSNITIRSFKMVSVRIL